MMADNNRYINQLIEMFTSGDGNSLRSEFHAWLTDEKHSEEKDNALRELWEQQADTSLSLDTLNSLETFKKEHVAKSAKRFIITPILKYAAMLVGVITLSTAYITYANCNIAPTEVVFIEHSSQIGEMIDIPLADGSSIKTNSNTIVIYNNSFGKDNRTIFLSGEAYFKVSKDSEYPFVVQTKNFTITALGTEFNVLSYSEDANFKTTLLSGSVKIESKSDKQDIVIEQYLNPEEQFVYNKITKRYNISTTHTTDVTAWQQGNLVFRGATIEEIINTLERQYDIDFVFETSTNDLDKYNFTFKKGTPLNELLRVIQKVSNSFNYTLKGNICFIHK